MCFLTKKKPKVKKTAPSAKEFRREKGNVEGVLPSGGQFFHQTPQSSTDVRATSSLSSLMSLTTFPVKAERQSVLKEVSVERTRLVKPEAPPLIKAAASSVGSSSEHHVTYHSSEIRVVPGNAVLSRGKQKETNVVKKQPKLKAKVEHSTVVTMPKVQPQVILSSGVQRLPPPLVSNRSCDRSHDSRSTNHTNVLQPPRVISMPTTSNLTSKTHKHAHKSKKGPHRSNAVGSLIKVVL